MEQPEALLGMAMYAQLMYNNRAAGSTSWHGDVCTVMEQPEALLIMEQPEALLGMATYALDGL